MAMGLTPIIWTGTGDKCVLPVPLDTTFDESNLFTANSILMVRTLQLCLSFPRLTTSLDWKIAGGTATGPSSFAAWQKIEAQAVTLNTGFSEFVMS